MRCLIVYSSKTGNTRKIAEALLAEMPEGTPCVPVKEAPAPDDFDLLCLGFWVKRGAPDPAMQRYMATVKDKCVGLFGTMGAWPDSEHARKCAERATTCMDGNNVLGCFLCQGKIDPSLLTAMDKNGKTRSAHPMTEERKARILAASTHPDEQDMANARAAFARMLVQARDTLTSF